MQTSYGSGRSPILGHNPTRGCVMATNQIFHYNKILSRSDYHNWELFFIQFFLSFENLI